jgi:hypothetical protein
MCIGRDFEGGDGDLFKGFVWFSVSYEYMSILPLIALLLTPALRVLEAFGCRYDVKPWIWLASSITLRVL